MARRSRKGKGLADSPAVHAPLVRGARLEPLRFVERELTHPDGRTFRVEVPVYPPFRLEDRPLPKPRRGRRRARDEAEEPAA